MRPGQQGADAGFAVGSGSAPQFGHGSSGPRSSEIVPHSRHISCIQQAGSPMGPSLGARGGDGPPRLTSPDATQAYGSRGCPNPARAGGSLPQAGCACGPTSGTGRVPDLQMVVHPREHTNYTFGLTPTN